MPCRRVQSGASRAAQSSPPPTQAAPFDEKDYGTRRAAAAEICLRENEKDVAPDEAGCQPKAVDSREGDSDEEGCQPEGLFTPGKRARYDKTGSVPFEILNLKSFKGGFLQSPIILKTVPFGETDMLRVNPREEWLAQAATGKVVRRGSWEKAVTRVNDQLDKAIAAAATGKEVKKCRLQPLDGRPWTSGPSQNPRLNRVLEKEVVLQGLPTHKLEICRTSTSMVSLSRLFVSRRPRNARAARNAN